MQLSPPHSRRLPLTGWRLGAGGASTKFPAGDKRSIPHKIFCGTTAPLAPNRTVKRWHSSESVVIVGYTQLSVRYSIPLLCRFALHCRYGTQFYYFVGLHYIVAPNRSLAAVHLPPLIKNVACFEHARIFTRKQFPAYGHIKF